MEEKEIGPNKIQLLWQTNLYDGMLSGFGLYEGNLVYLDVCGKIPGEALLEKWEKLEELLIEDFGEEEGEEIWEYLEDRYELSMKIGWPRMFKVFSLDEETKKRTQLRREQFRLHVGAHCEYYYDKFGKPRTSRQNWGGSPLYKKTHFYERFKPQDQISWENLICIGEIAYTNLFSTNAVRLPMEDPRSPDLKEYQKNWKEGDPIQLEW